MERGQAVNRRVVAAQRPAFLRVVEHDMLVWAQYLEPVLRTDPARAQASRSEGVPDQRVDDSVGITRRKFQQEAVLVPQTAMGRMAPDAALPEAMLQQDDV